MTTRVDPEQYRDTPIFRELLRDRKGRWPGIPMEELPALPVPHDGAPYTLPVMSLIQPISDPAPERPRPYAKEFLAYDPEETAAMPLSHLAEG